jgi:hypothetical protein
LVKVLPVSEDQVKLRIAVYEAGPGCDISPQLFPLFFFILAQLARSELNHAVEGRYQSERNDAKPAVTPHGSRPVPDPSGSSFF